VTTFSDTVAQTRGRRVAGAAVALGPPRRRKLTVGVVEIVGGQPHLLQVVHATHPVGRFADFLNGRQEQADQDRDDGNYDQQLDECEARAPSPCARRAHTAPFLSKSPSSILPRETLPGSRTRQQWHDAML